MAIGLRQYFVGISLVVLFGISMLFFMMGMIQQNNPSSELLNNNIFNETLATFNNTANSFEAFGESAQSDLADKTNPNPVYIFLIAESLLTIPLNFLSIIVTGAKTLVTYLFTGIFGSGNQAFYIIFGVMNGIILITIVTLVMRAIRTGETER